MAVTLIGEKIAKVGLEFLYTGALSDCKDCKLRNVCFALDEGKQYKIIRVRDVKHDCEIHEGGARVVEVEKTDMQMLVESRLGIAGSTMTYTPRDRCLNFACDRYRLCFPLFVKPGERFKITSVVSEVQCPEGLKLAEVRLAKNE